MKRLIFSHVPKAGGSTFLHLLDHSSFFDFDSVESMELLENDLAAAIERASRSRFIHIRNYETNYQILAKEPGPGMP